MYNDNDNNHHNNNDNDDDKHRTHRESVPGGHMEAKI